MANGRNKRQHHNVLVKLRAVKRAETGLSPAQGMQRATRGDASDGNEGADSECAEVDGPRSLRERCVVQDQNNNLFNE